jgi:hypothetical protein
VERRRQRQMCIRDSCSSVEANVEAIFKILE